MSLTAERVGELLAYDPTTGFVVWKVQRGRARAGERAGAVHRRTNKRRIRIDGTKYFEHRIAWLLMTGAWPADEIDHRNGDGCDNRWGNLREATRAENAQNVGVTKAVSGFRGVRFYGGKFAAAVKHAGRMHYAGRHETAEAAYEAYQAKRAELFTYQPDVRNGAAQGV